jgi:hypothetical protein
MKELATAEHGALAAIFHIVPNEAASCLLAARPAPLDASKKFPQAVCGHYWTLASGTEAGR